MKYALLIYPKPGSHEELGEDESKSVSAEYWAFREDPRCLGGAHLQPIETATTSVTLPASFKRVASSSAMRPDW